MDSRFRRCTNYVRNNFDEMAILAAFVSIANDASGGSLSRDESFVLSAIRRSSNRFSDASIEEIGEMLRGYDPAQIPGLVNNVKGILFELEFVEIENSDGCSTRILPPSQPGYYWSGNHQTRREPDDSVHFGRRMSDIGMKERSLRYFQGYQGNPSGGTSSEWKGETGH